MFSDKLSPRCHVKKIVALLFLAALATSAGLFFFSTKEPPSNTTPSSETDSARLHDKRIVEKGFDLTSLSREHLLERVQVQWNKSDHQLAEREVLVDEGMTVLTGGYEEVPGQFIFSAITPRFAKSKHGTEIVVFDLKRYLFGIDGTYKVIQEWESQVNPEAKTGFGDLRGNVEYRMTVRAKRDESTDKIRLHTIENQVPR